MDGWQALLQEHRPSLKFVPAGHQTLKGLCVHPDHQDTDPSFYLHAGKGYAKCYGGSCGYFESNPLRLIAHIIDSSYAGALEYVLQTFKPAFLPKKALEELEKQRLNQLMKQEIFGAAHQIMCAAIGDPDNAEYEWAKTGLDWLINVRKIPKDALHALPVALMPILASLGKQIKDRYNVALHCWQQENNPAVAEPVNTAELATEYFADYVREPAFAGGILLPLYSSPSDIGNFKLRSPDSSKKFLITTDEHYDQTGIFGLGWARYKQFWGQGKDQGSTHVVEGEFDALALMAHYVQTNDVKFPAVSAGGGGGAPYIEKTLLASGITHAHLVGDAPFDKGDEVVQKWMSHLRELDAKIFMGWDRFPNVSDVDEALNTKDPATVIAALWDDRATTFVPPWDWASRRASEEIEAIPESDFRARMETAANHGKYLNHRLESARFIETLAEQYNLNASLLKREITSRGGSEKGFVQNCVDALKEFLFVVGTQVIGTHRSLVVYNTRSNQFIKIQLASAQAIVEELAPEVGTLESFITERVGQPSFLEFPEADTEGQILSQLEDKLVKYLKMAVVNMTQGAPDVMAAKRYKQGYHCIREGQNIQEYIVCGTDVFRANRDGAALTYSKLEGPADMEKGIVFDIGLTGSPKKAWYPDGLSVEKLDSGQSVNLPKLYDDLVSVYSLGYKFKNQDITAQMLAALMLCYPVMDALERPVLVFISGDTNSGKSSLLSTFTGMNYPGIQLLYASQGYESYSAAGVAGYADGDSRLLALDEFESGEDERGGNVSRILEMFRGLVSGSADRIRGRPDGTSFSQSFRLPVIFSAIKGAERPQDLNRMLAIEMQKVPNKINPVHEIQNIMGIPRIQEMAHEIAVGMYPHALELARLEDEVRKEFVALKITNPKLEIEWRLASSLFSVMAVLKFLGKDYMQFLETYIAEHEYVIKQTAVSSETHGYLKSIMRNPCIAQAEGPPMTISQLLVSPEQRDDINASNKGVYFDEKTKTLLLLVDQSTGMIPFHLRGKMTGANLKTVLERHPSALTPLEIERSGVLRRVGRYLGAGIKLEDIVLLDAEPWLTANGDSEAGNAEYPDEEETEEAVAEVVAEKAAVAAPETVTPPTPPEDEKHAGAEDLDSWKDEESA